MDLRYTYKITVRTLVYTDVIKDLIACLDQELPGWKWHKTKWDLSRKTKSKQTCFILYWVGEELPHTTIDSLVSGGYNWCNTLSKVLSYKQVNIKLTSKVI